MSGISQSDAPQLPWSSDPNAPQIPYLLYQAEKYNFAGILITGAFYGEPKQRDRLSLLISSVRSTTLGIATVLFFQCMTALLNPFNRTKDGVKWGLVLHTTTMFSLATVFTGITLHIQSISFINSREFTGDTLLPPGPLGYQVLIYSKPIGIAPSTVFLLNQWLADGLLVCLSFTLFARVSHTSPSPSSIVVTSFMP